MPVTSVKLSAHRHSWATQKPFCKYRCKHKYVVIAANLRCMQNIAQRLFKIDYFNTQLPAEIRRKCLNSRDRHDIAQRTKFYRLDYAGTRVAGELLT